MEKAPKRRSKWLWGCGIGCGAVVLIVVVLGAVATSYLSGMFRGVRDAENSQEELVEQFGEIEQYTPAADGAVAASRVEIFLAVRDSLAEQVGLVEQALAGFRPDDWEHDGPGPKVVLEALRGVGELINPIGEYMDRRNRLLLAAGMGLGEYVYIYCLSYYSYLEYRPTDTPGGAYGDRDHCGEGTELFRDEDSSLSPRQVRIRYKRYFGAILRNQLDALLADASSVDAPDWRTTVARELERFELDRDHVAWQNGLPAGIAAALEPYRDRLAATYCRTTNPLELPPSEKGWRAWVNDD